MTVLLEYLVDWELRLTVTPGTNEGHPTLVAIKVSLGGSSITT